MTQIRESAFLIKYDIHLVSSKYLDSKDLMHSSKNMVILTSFLCIEFNGLNCGLVSVIFLFLGGAFVVVNTFSHFSENSAGFLTRGGSGIITSLKVIVLWESDSVFYKLERLISFSDSTTTSRVSKALEVERPRLFKEILEFCSFY